MQQVSGVKEKEGAIAEKVRDNRFRDSNNKTLKINNVGKFIRKH